MARAKKEKAEKSDKEKEQNEAANGTSTTDEAIRLVHESTLTDLDIMDKEINEYFDEVMSMRREVDSVAKRRGDERWKLIRFYLAPVMKIKVKRLEDAGEVITSDTLEEMLIDAIDEKQAVVDVLQERVNIARNRKRELKEESRDANRKIKSIKELDHKIKELQDDYNGKKKQVLALTRLMRFLLWPSVDQSKITAVIFDKEDCLDEVIHMQSKDKSPEATRLEFWTKLESLLSAGGPARK